MILGPRDILVPAPPREPHSRRNARQSNTVKAQALALLFCTQWKLDKEKYKAVSEITHISVRGLYRLVEKARQMGFKPEYDLRIEERYVAPIKPPGPKRTATSEETADKVISLLEKNRNGREKSAEVLGFQAGISQASVLRILKRRGYHKRKPTWKPILNEDQKEARLQFALRYKDWKLEDWKAVIWSDETSVILGHKRGGTRLWRTVNQAHHKQCIRRRWKGYSEFMFWGCFSYDKKGPCHIWQTETAKEKKEAQKAIDQWNRANEERLKAEWQLKTDARRLKADGTQPRGKTPIWRFTEKNGKRERKAKAGGIDWWRYGKEILLKKLIPFAKQCKKERPTTIVQEDNAPSHAHQSQKDIFNINEIQRLIWPGNSPDLNMIEPCWPYMKRRTTVRGSTTFRNVMERRWINTWEEMPQAKIQAWIERIPRHIQEIIAIDGDNTYKEGRTGKDTRDWKAEGIRRLKGKLSQRVDFGTEGGILEISDNDGDEVEAEEVCEEVEADNDDIERPAANKRRKKRQKKVRAPAKTVEEEVEAQLEAKRQEAQTSPRKQLVEARIDAIARDLRQLLAPGLRGYPPPQEEVVEEVVEVIGPSTASPAILERVGARRASRKAKRTAVRSQRARNTIKTAIEAENAVEATVEATVEAATTRLGRVVKKKVRWEA